MEPWWAALVREQQQSHFSDIAGASAWFTLPVSDRLLTALISERLPASWPIKTLQIEAGPANQLTVHLRLTKPALLPTLHLRLAIEQQPEFPGRPILVLRIASGALAALAGPALRVLEALPQGIRLDGDRISINVATLLDQYGAADLLQYLVDLNIATIEHRVIVSARAVVPQTP
jgi:hypothetical protein